MSVLVEKTFKKAAHSQIYTSSEADYTRCTTGPANHITRLLLVTTIIAVFACLSAAPQTWPLTFTPSVNW